MTCNSYYMHFQSPWFTQKFEGIGERFKGPGQTDLLVQDALDRLLAVFQARSKASFFDGPEIRHMERRLALQRMYTKPQTETKHRGTLHMKVVQRRAAVERGYHIQDPLA